MEDKKWVKIALSPKELSFGFNGLMEVDADGKKICLAQFREEIYAFAPKCPHAGGAFVNGWLDPQGNVVCPLHRYKFCMKNGRNVSGEGYALKQWPVEVREDGVYVKLDTKGWPGLW